MHISIKLTDRDLLNIDNAAVNELIQVLKTISTHTAQGTEEPAASQETSPAEKIKTKVKTGDVKSEKKPEPAKANKPASETVEPIAEDKAADYTALRDELRKELAAIARAGKSAGLKKLLEEYGVEKFSELPDKKLEDFRAAAKAL
mgnify:CR=1 FL=1